MNKDKLAAGFAAWLEETGQPSAPFIGLDRTGPLGGDWLGTPMMFAYCNNCRTLYMPAHGMHTICRCNGVSQLTNVMFGRIKEGPNG